MGIRLDPDSLPVELRELANKHNAMLDRLQTGFRRLSEFSSDIAHELKNATHQHYYAKSGHFRCVSNA